MMYTMQREKKIFQILRILVQNKKELWYKILHDYEMYHWKSLELFSDFFITCKNIF
jgi:hypothetical protein